MDQSKPVKSGFLGHECAIQGETAEALKEVVEIADNNFSRLDAGARDKLMEFLARVDKLIPAQLLKDY